jgi:hypothetical protein
VVYVVGTRQTKRRIHVLCVGLEITLRFCANALYTCHSSCSLFGFRARSACVQNVSDSHAKNGAANGKCTFPEILALILLKYRHTCTHAHICMRTHAHTNRNTQAHTHRHAHNYTGDNLAPRFIVFIHIASGAPGLLED